MAFIVKSNIVKEEIQDQLGRVIGLAIYNPTDAGILIRARENKTKLQEVKDKLENYTTEDINSLNVIDIIAEGEAAIREYCNNVFAPDFYESAFSSMSPFTIMENGKFFAVEVIEKVLEDIKLKNEDYRAKQKKYLSGYIKED